MERLRQALVAVAAACLLGVCLLEAAWWPTRAGAGDGATEVVRAQRLEVVDAGGKLRGWLGVDDDGSATLSLKSESGKAVAQLRVASDGSPALGGFQRDGARPRAWLGVSEQGAGGLVLFDREGEPRLDLSVAAAEATPLPKPAVAPSPTERREPPVQPRGRNGRDALWRRWHAQRPHQWAGLRLRGKGGQARARLAVADEGGWGLSVLGADGKARSEVFVGRHGPFGLACVREGTGQRASLAMDTHRWEAAPGVTLSDRERGRSLGLVPGALHIRAGREVHAGLGADFRDRAFFHLGCPGSSVDLDARQSIAELEMRGGPHTKGSGIALEAGDGCEVDIGRISIYIAAGFNMGLILSGPPPGRASLSVGGPADLEFGNRDHPALRLGSENARGLGGE